MRWVFGISRALRHQIKFPITEERAKPRTAGHHVAISKKVWISNWNFSVSINLNLTLGVNKSKDDKS